MKASLDERLKNVKWGEFRLGDLFEIRSSKKKYDANKVTVKEKGGYPYIVRQSTNNGQKGFIEESENYLNEGNTVSFGQDTATIFYQETPYFTGDKIKIFKPKIEKFNKNNAPFFLVAMNRTFSSFSWGGSSFNVNILSNQIVSLPITPAGSIDFEFMESFIAELEAERIAELEAERIAELSAYLAVSGLDNYKLSDAERAALDRLEDVEWGQFNVIDVFNVKNTSSILSSQVKENSGTVPYLCASADNNSISSYISFDETYKEEGNCVFIGGKTFVVTCQKDDFYSNDSHNLALYLKNHKPTEAELLYLATCVRKSLGHKYTWGDSISKSKIKKDKIKLVSNGEIVDFTDIQNYITAVKKLVIKDVVDYANEKIEVAKKIIDS
ncbi:MAG: restriction endonuclease subunit S [Clostridia bacterium]|nr:restriction endonuclease subunit S [Clostridia bacterium]